MPLLLSAFMKDLKYERFFSSPVLHIDTEMDSYFFLIRRFCFLRTSM